MPPLLPATYLFLMESLRVVYPSSPALSALTTKLSMAPSSCRHAWRKWRKPSTSLH